MTDTQSITTYIEKNYITINQLASRANLTLIQLNALINNECIPKHSHRITKDIVYHSGIFGESSYTENVVFYYHPSLISFAIRANKYLARWSYVEVAEMMKKDFNIELNDALLTVKEARQMV